eukprot:10679552-Prorocentrum_lima.AAC.1
MALWPWTRGLMLAWHGGRLYCRRIGKAGVASTSLMLLDWALTLLRWSGGLLADRWRARLDASPLL